jgi:hypothetical protein
VSLDVYPWEDLRVHDTVPALQMAVAGGNVFFFAIRFLWQVLAGFAWLLGTGVAVADGADGERRRPRFSELTRWIGVDDLI